MCRYFIYLILGALMAVAVAWFCAMWSPIRSTISPFPNPAHIAEIVNPDGGTGLYDEATGIGWHEMTYEGTRSGRDPSYVIWRNPYGGVYFREAGWPLRCVRSRVEVLDTYRTFLADDVTGTKPIHCRVRWELPVGEIVRRGLSTDDLPAFANAIANRRLPIVPMGLGFSIDTLLYSVLIAWFVHWVRRITLRRRTARGFPVRLARTL